MRFRRVHSDGQGEPLYLLEIGAQLFSRYSRVAIQIDTRVQINGMFDFDNIGAQSLVMALAAERTSRHAHLD